MTWDVRYLSSGATPEGTVRFTPQRVSAVYESGVTHVVDTTEVALVDGVLSVDLPSTNDPDITPRGWGYLVEAEFDGAPAAFVIAVPYDAGSINLGSLVPLTSAPVPVGSQLSADLAAERGARIQADLELEAAVAGSQPLDADLTAIAALDSATSGVMATDGAGWIRKTYAQFKTAIGLGNVDNTSDANKPVSTATQAALDLTESAAHASATYQPLQVADSFTINTTDASGNPTRTTEVYGSTTKVTDYTWNVDGTVATETVTINGTAGTTRTFAYSSGVLTGWS